jgi:hypothetical protein
MVILSRKIGSMPPRLAYPFLLLFFPLEILRIPQLPRGELVAKLLNHHVVSLSSDGL